MTVNEVDLSLYNGEAIGEYSSPINNVDLTLRKVSKNIFRMRFTDADNERFEIPDEAEVNPKSANKGFYFVLLKRVVTHNL
jgi:hypothetical protein